MNDGESAAVETPLYDSIVLKVSGESLGSGHLLDPERFSLVAQMITDVHSMGVAVSVVTGGGNIFRGGLSDTWGLPPNQADLAGMAATGINVLLLEGLLKSSGVPTAVFSRGPSAGIGSLYQPEEVRACIDRGAVVLLAGGLGIPGISTDVTAVDAAIDTGAPAVIMSKHGVDGIYTSDPRGGGPAVFIPTLDATEALKRELRVMDMAALILARDHGKLIHVVPAAEANAPCHVLEGKEIGSRILPV